MAARRPNHEVLAEATALRRRVEDLERVLVEARRDEHEYRRGYEVGYQAGRRRADGDQPRPDRVKRRVRGDMAYA